VLARGDGIRRAIVPRESRETRWQSVGAVLVGEEGLGRLAARMARGAVALAVRWHTRLRRWQGLGLYVDLVLA
jgi:hypothetical protein